MSLPLNQIIGSLVREFEKASLSADLNRELLREAYVDNPVLNDITPSRIRISEATICIPLAFIEIKKSNKNVPEISKRQIEFLALNDQDSIPDKDSVAGLIYKYLIADNKAELSRKALIEDIQKIGKSIVKDFKLTSVGIQNLKALQKAINKQPPVNDEANFTYNTEELEKLPSDRIFRLEFKIIAD